jgi:hypothetical protein
MAEYTNNHPFVHYGPCDAVQQLIAVYEERLGRDALSVQAKQELMEHLYPELGPFPGATKR